MKKIKNIIIITLIIIIVFPILFVSSVILIDSVMHPNEVPSFFGWKPFIVLTSSMEKEIMAGDVAVVKEINTKSLKKGDVIAFKVENDTVITHRIIDIDNDKKSSYYITKGDNNQTKDNLKVYPNQIEGLYIFKINGLGKIAMFLQSTTGILVCMTIPIALLFIIQVIDNFKNNKENEQTEEELLDRIKELEKEKDNLLRQKNKKSYKPKK